MAEILSPEWIKHKAPENGENCHAISFRYPYLDNAIRNIVSSLPSDPNILYVGVGRSRYNGEEKAASGCFELASILQALGKGYRMSLLDSDSNNLEMAMAQDTISIPDLTPEDARNRLLTAYLNDTNQGLPKKDSGNIHHVLIPGSFREKRLSGEIKQLEADIVKDKIAYGPYDFIHCLSVIPHIENYNSKLLALHNLSSSLKEGGLMLIEHETSCLPERAPSETIGLIMDYGPRLNIAIEEGINKRKSASYLLLKKKENISSAAHILSKL